MSIICLWIIRYIMTYCVPGVEEEECVVPCPLDCRLSDWSAWSSCSAPCGGGVKVRAQWLREKPFNGGRPCPKLNVKNQVRVAMLQVHFWLFFKRQVFKSDLFYNTKPLINSHWTLYANDSQISINCFILSVSRVYSKNTLHSCWAFRASKHRTLFAQNI